VNTFVVSAPKQAIAVLAKDDMPDGNGIYRSIWVEAGQQGGDYPAFCFDDACCNNHRPAGKDDKGQQRNADAGYGEDPTVFDAWPHCLDKVHLLHTREQRSLTMHPPVAFPSLKAQHPGLLTVLCS
jgi:hypothetical protein